MHIDIWSDVVCPWCFLGKRRFERAVARLDDPSAIEVRWRAFQLDPSAGPEPGDLRRSIEAKYGPGAFDGMTTRLTDLGAAEGIDYRFDRALRVNTRDAHRLLAWAWDTAGAAGQGTLAERLFVAYFEQGANVADHQQLAGFAADVGLDAEDAADALSEGRYADEVDADIAGATELDITGVPAFVVGERFLIPGAQEVDTFEQLLTRAHERFSANS